MRAKASLFAAAKEGLIRPTTAPRATDRRTERPEEKASAERRMLREIPATKVPKRTEWRMPFVLCNRPEWLPAFATFVTFGNYSGNCRPGSLALRTARSDFGQEDEDERASPMFPRGGGGEGTIARKFGITYEEQTNDDSEFGNLFF